MSSHIVSVPPPQRRLINDHKVSLLQKSGELETKLTNKSSILQLTKLHSRDMRLHLPNQPTGLFIRDNCIIVNMFYVKVLIMSNLVIIYDLDTNNEIDGLISNIKDKLKTLEIENKLPFEFFILEAILSDICVYIQNQYNNLKELCEPILSSLLSLPTQKKSKELLPIKHDLKKLELATKNIYDSLENLLESASDMEKMYLSQKDKDNGEERGKEEKFDWDQEDIEDLLETYFFEMGKTLNRLHIMENTIDETDDTVLMMLDIARNKIMNIDLWINLLTYALSFGTLITGIFGMNISNHLESDHKSFIIVSAAIGLIIILIIMGFKVKLKGVKI